MSAAGNDEDPHARREFSNISSSQQKQITTVCKYLTNILDPPEWRERFTMTPAFQGIIKLLVIDNPKSAAKSAGELLLLLSKARVNFSFNPPTPLQNPSLNIETAAARANEATALLRKAATILNSCDGFNDVIVIGQQPESIDVRKFEDVVMLAKQGMLGNTIRQFADNICTLSSDQAASTFDHLRSNVTPTLDSARAGKGGAANDPLKRDRALLLRTIADLLPSTKPPQYAAVAAAASLTGQLFTRQQAASTLKFRNSKGQ